MIILLSGLLNNTNNLISTKFTEGFTPLQRKVALFAAVFFALAAVGYVIYKSCFKYTPQIKAIDLKEKKEPVETKEQNKSHQAEQYDVDSEASEKKSLSKEPLDAEKTREGREVKIEEVVPSTVDIAIDNADQLRSLIKTSAAEALDPSGQLRTLYFDGEGRLQAIKGPDDKILNNQAKADHSYQIKIRFQKSQSIKNAPFSLEDDLANCPKTIQVIIDSTLAQLNQLANGAFHIAKADKNLSVVPGAPKWLTVLENVKDYPSSSLLREYQELIEDNESSLLQQRPIDVIPKLEAEDDLPELEDDAPELDSQESKLNPNWINDNPDTSLNDLGLTDYDKLKDFIVEHGGQLKCLNLNGHKIDNDQFMQLIKSCPNLNQLSISSPLIENYALKVLKGMPLTSVSFCACPNLTDNALEHLKGMPLTSVNFNYCWKLTDKALEHLKDMPLTSVEFSDCRNLTDKALEHLKGMPLTSVRLQLVHESYRQDPRAT